MLGKPFVTVCVGVSCAVVVHIITEIGGYEVVSRLTISLEILPQLVERSDMRNAIGRVRIIDPNHGFLIETDLNDPVLQGISVAFGFFATRTPLCQGCP
jgi:hypothetical protein